ncbi:MAG TPA: LytTR family DNA-binding domain-containing protein [Saprospiraceae bacterium]|nr:LytTR family DNA-binding domain-containing protein [Saprospiraceae bacterium]HRK81309.1 LytTR family DNA-binding domain-containing protein [Saprospiraceae bacterium]
MDTNTTAAAQKIRVDFRVGRGWAWLVYTLIGILLYQLFTLQRPGFGEFRLLLEGRIFEWLRSLLLYYFVFELLSVFIFLRLTLLYFSLGRLDEVALSFKGWLLHQLRFLPLVLTAILVFGPITNGLRYLVVFYPDYVWGDYFPEYFFTARMYVNYLLPYLVFGYLILNFNLFLNYNEWNKERFSRLSEALQTPEAPKYLQYVQAGDDEGTLLLPVDQVWWFEVEGKNYMAVTNGKTYGIGLTISELEEQLDPELFFRVNRAVLVQLRFVKNYSYWENDKYILRMNDDKTEFVMQRTRLKTLKERLNPGK